MKCGVLWETNKDNKKWFWLALDTRSRQVIAFHVGDRSQYSAAKLWNKIPRIYRKEAIFYTDQWKAYKKVIPSDQHWAVNKKSGKTNYIERFMV